MKKSSGYSGRRYAPYVFPEQGVVILLLVFNSPGAIGIDSAINVEINIETMRAFAQARFMAAAYQDLVKQLIELQDKTEVLPASAAGQLDLPACAAC